MQELPNRSTPDDPAWSPTQSLAVARAGALSPAVLENLADVETTHRDWLVETIWQGWDLVHLLVHNGDAVYLLRHHSSGEWTAVLWCGEPLRVSGPPPPFGLGDWPDLDLHERRLRVLDNTVLPVTAETLTGLVDRARHAAGPDSDPDRSWSEDAQAHARRVRFCDSEVSLYGVEVLQVVLDAPHPQAEAVRMLAGLGAYTALMDAASERERTYATDQLAAVASGMLDATVHRHRKSVLHQRGAGAVSGECWACRLRDRHLVDVDFGFGPEHWDPDTNRPVDDFFEIVGERVDELSHQWVDDENQVGTGGLDPAALVDVVVGEHLAVVEGAAPRSGQGGFFAAVLAASGGWKPVRRGQFETADGEDIISVTSWTRGDAVALSLCNDEVDAENRWAGWNLGHRLQVVSDFYDRSFFFADGQPAGPGHPLSPVMVQALSQLEMFSPDEETLRRVYLFLDDAFLPERPA